MPRCRTLTGRTERQQNRNRYLSRNNNSFEIPFLSCSSRKNLCGKMTKKRNSEVYTSPSLKKQKSPVHKKPVLIRKKAPVPKLLLGLRSYLASSDGNRKRKYPVESPPDLPIQASSDDKRKRKSPAKCPPVLPIQASSDGNRKRKSLVESPPVLTIQASNDDKRKRKSPAKSLPVLPNQASSGCIRKRKSPAESSLVLAVQASSDDNRELMSPDESPSVFPFECELNNQMSEQSVATAEILNRVVKSEITDQSYEAREHDENDLPEVTSLVALSTCPASMRILRESNAVSPATVMPIPSLSAKIRVGFDRNLEPEKIVKMAELRGKDYFIMKWKGSEIMDIVPTEIANKRCPQVVIEFYEKHLTNVHNRAMDNIE